MRLLVAALLIIPAHARDWDFDDAVEELESRLHTRRLQVPFFGAAMWFSGAVARPLGAKDFRMAIFEDVRQHPTREFTDLKRLGPSWRPMLRVSKRGSEYVTIYARDDGDWSHLILLTIDHKDAVLMQFKLRPSALLRLIAEKARNAS